MTCRDRDCGRASNYGLRDSPTHAGVRRERRRFQGRLEPRTCWRTEDFKAFGGTLSCDGAAFIQWLSSSRRTSWHARACSATFRAAPTHPWPIRRPVLRLMARRQSTRLSWSRARLPTYFPGLRAQTVRRTEHAPPTPTSRRSMAHRPPATPCSMASPLATLRAAPGPATHRPTSKRDRTRA